MSAIHGSGMYDFVAIARHPSHPKRHYDGTIILGGSADDDGMAEIAIRCLQHADPQDRFLTDPLTRFKFAFRVVA